MGILNVTVTLCLTICIYQNLYASYLLSGCRYFRTLHILLSTGHADYNVKTKKFLLKRPRLKITNPNYILSTSNPLPHPHTRSLNYL